MKRVLCLLITLLLCLSLTACGSANAPAEPDAAVPSEPASPPSTFPPEYLALQSEAASYEELISECADLAVTGDLVWRCTHGQVLCEDPAKDEAPAALPLSELLADGELPGLPSLASWSGDSILFCLPSVGESGRQRVELLELGLDKGSITVRSRRDADKALGFLYEEEWLEVDMNVNAQRLFFAALDPSFQVHFFLYTPETEALLTLGERDLAEYRAAIPYGEDMLIVEPDMMDDAILNFTRLSLADGSTEKLAEITVDSTQEMYNFAYDQAANRLYYAVNSTVYALTLVSGEDPAAIGALSGATAGFRLGALVGGRYVCHGVEGQLLSCDAHGQLSVVQLRIVDTQGLDLLTEAARDFSLLYPEYTVSILTGIEESEISGKLSEAPDAYDACVITLGSEAWDTFRSGGFLTELSGSDLLSAVSSDLTARMRGELVTDGKLLALPLSVSNICHQFNLAAFEELSATSAERFPTDWEGFLTLLQKLAKSSTLEGNDRYSLYSGDISVEQFREITLGSILQDSLLLAKIDPEHTDELHKALLSVLKAFNKVEWDHLGLSTDYYDGGDMADGGFLYSDQSGSAADSVNMDVTGDFKKSEGNAVAGGGMPSEYNSLKKPLTQDSFLEIEVTDMEEGMAFWPLAVRPGGDRLIPQSIMLIFVNAHSLNPDAARTFVEYLWYKMDIETKMMLCPSVNETVPNPYYEEDLVYYQERLKEIEQLAEEATNAFDKKIISTELEDLRAYFERFKKYAAWTVSEDSLGYYRSVQDDLIPMGDRFWLDSAAADAQFDFLDGKISPKELIEKLEAYL